jgi:riboflavin biosynthesis pyrimidine reductase
MVMGLLRAAADAVIVGAGTLHAASANHRWTADYIYPDLAEAFRSLRSALGMADPPLNVVVTASGKLDPPRRLFRSGEAPVLIVTTAEGAGRIEADGLPESVEVAVVGEAGPIGARAILAAVCRARPCERILIEAGPRLTGDFVAEQQLDELFLTVAPQVAGRDDALPRPGFVAGKRFAPEDPRWGTLVGLKRGGSHLFLRYHFPVVP